MSALQIENSPSDPANAPHDYTLADLRATVLEDHGLTVVARAAVGLLAAVAVAIMVAGIATQSTFAIVSGILATIVMGGTLTSLFPRSAKSIGR